MTNGSAKDSITARLDGEADSTGGIALAGYRDFTLIGRGGDSVVYRARQDGLSRDVAVKVVQLSDPAAVARFSRELEITVRLGRQHPNIVTVHDTGVLDSGEPCLVMEYYDRGSLHDRLRQHGPLPVAEVVAVGMVMADALGFAHGHGVLHRDVKPQNILVLPTSYVLADFGIARRVDAEHSASLERFSYRHASPQVLDGEPPAVADDLYSLGSTLYTLLDGRPPFADDGEDSPLAYLRRVRTASPRPLTRPDLPAGLVEIITSCLAKQRADRFPDAATLRQALAALPTTATVPPAAAPTDPWAPPPGWTPGAAPAAAKTRPAVGVPADPAPRSPATPVATSALAHLATAPEITSTAGDDDHGADATAPPPVDADEPAAPAPAARSRRRIIVLAAAALVLGTSIGVASALLGQAGGAGSEDLAPSDQGVPTYTGTLPPQTEPPQVDVGDPELAPEITSLEDRSTSAELRWTDPSDGTGIFVVTRRTGADVEVLARLPVGTTQYIAEGLDPAVAQYCFQVIALVDGDRRGVSAERCTPTR